MPVKRTVQLISPPSVPTTPRSNLEEAVPSAVMVKATLRPCGA